MFFVRFTCVNPARGRRQTACKQCEVRNISKIGTLIKFGPGFGIPNAVSKLLILGNLGSEPVPVCMAMCEAKLIVQCVRLIVVLYDLEISMARALAVPPME